MKNFFKNNKNIISHSRTSKKIKYLILLVIVGLAIFLRLFSLGKNPAGFFCDEASIGYNAYSLVNTGKDEWGQSWPLFFRAFGEYKNPVMTYSVMPSILIFGLNQFSTRLPSAVYGVLSIILCFLLFKKLFGYKTSLVISYFLSISPWFVHLSRINLEGIVPMVFFTLLGTYFWVDFIENPSKKYLYLFFSIIGFSLAIYSYFPARIFIPLYCLSLVITNYRIFWKYPRVFFLSLILTVIFIFPLLNHLIYGGGLSRWNQVNGNLPIPTLISKYFEYFTPDYLFFKGDIDLPNQFVTRHSLRGIGENFPWQLPFFYFGVISALRQYRKNKYSIFLIWLFFYPFTDLFTSGLYPQATRSLIGVVPVVFFFSIGIIKFLKTIKLKLIKYIFIVGLFLLSLASTVSLYRLIVNYPGYSSDYWGWQYGAKPVMEYFLTSESSYQQLCLEGAFNAPEIFLKFYDPQNLCQNKCQICDYTLYDPHKSQLFALSYESYQKLSTSPLENNFLIQKNIYYPDTTTAFVIGEFKSKPILKLE
ncbi:MAG: glycosyltransferase family 39 protein [Candidatus Shapirobacteria bacterium]